MSHKFGYEMAANNKVSAARKANALLIHQRFSIMSSKYEI